MLMLIIKGINMKHLHDVDSKHNIQIEMSNANIANH